jgi:hypothetical protein
VWCYTSGFEPSFRDHVDLAIQTILQEVLERNPVDQTESDIGFDIDEYVYVTVNAIDNEPYGAARTRIGMCKVAMAALGTSRDTPLAKMWMGVPMLAVADGPTEVHQRQGLHQPAKPQSQSPWFPGTPLDKPACRELAQHHRDELECDIPTPVYLAGAT